MSDSGTILSVAAHRDHVQGLAGGRARRAYRVEAHQMDAIRRAKQGAPRLVERYVLKLSAGGETDKGANVPVPESIELGVHRKWFGSGRPLQSALVRTPPSG